MVPMGNVTFKLSPHVQEMYRHLRMYTFPARLTFGVYVWLHFTLAALPLEYLQATSSAAELSKELSGMLRLSRNLGGPPDPGVATNAD